MRLARFVFQACAFNHSAISPLWNQRVASGPIRIAQNLPSRTSNLTSRVVPIAYGDAIPVVDHEL